MRRLGASSAVFLLAFGLTAAGAESRASAKWTEYGATEKAWKASHVPDPNPKLNKGCCFLPRQRDGTDRWFAVTYQKFQGVSRVFTFEMSFVPAISVANARAVARREAPPVPKLVFAMKKHDCLLIEYRSAALSRAFQGKTAMVAGLYSSAAGRFNGRTVSFTIFTPSPTGDRSIAC